MRENKKAEPAPEILRMYHLEPAPPKYELQQYIELCFSEKDNRYFTWYLHCYEPALNRIVRSAAEHNGMLHHFEDLKAAAVLGMLEALQKYDMESGVPFLAFQKSYIRAAIGDYIRINRDGMITMTRDTYPVLKKIMALFYNGGEHIDNDSICRIAETLGLSVKMVRAYLSIGLLNDHRVDLYRSIDDEDNSAGEYIPDSGGSAEQMYFRTEVKDAVRDAYFSLSYREQRIVAQRLAFCSECLSTVTMDGGERVPIEKQTFFDIALSHGLASAEAAEKIYHGTLEKMQI